MLFLFSGVKTYLMAMSKLISEKYFKALYRDIQCFFDGK